MKKQHKNESYADFKERRKRRRNRDKIQLRKWNLQKWRYTKTVWVGNLYFTHKECAKYLGITQRNLSKKIRKGIPLKKM